jgi:putative flippase GtrA
MNPLPHRKIPTEFLHFLSAGAAGFGVDSLILLALVHGAGWQPMLARLASFALALLATWLINRMWTFRPATSDKSARGIGAEFLGYCGVQLTGGAANFAIYATIVAVAGQSAVQLLVALAAGSAAGLAINYLGAHKFVFARKA